MNNAFTIKIGWIKCSGSDANFPNQLCLNLSIMAINHSYQPCLTCKIMRISIAAGASLYFFYLYKRIQINPLHHLSLKKLKSEKRSMGLVSAGYFMQFISSFFRIICGQLFFRASMVLSESRVISCECMKIWKWSGNDY